MNSRVLLLASLFGGIMTLSTKAQTITAPTGQNLTITNPVDVTGAGNTINVPTDGIYKIGGVNVLAAKTTNLLLGENTGNALTSGTKNLFMGTFAGNATTIGDYNVFLGDHSGFKNVNGLQNLFMGSYSGGDNLSGKSNAFIGANSGRLNQSGDFNVFVGEQSGYSNLSGSQNLFMGAFSGYTNGTGTFNDFIGNYAGYSNSTGQYNVFIGDHAGFTTNASQNLFMGGYAGYLNTGGQNNAFIGTNAGRSNTTGQNNVYIGDQAGLNMGIGQNNTFLGAGSGATGSNLTNATAIGANASVLTSNTVVLGNAATTITGIGLAAGVSGLRFANVTSATTPTAVVGGNKILTVDGSGNVVLGTLASGSINSVGSPVAETTWKNQDGYLYNNSTNGVVINGTGLDGNSLIVKGGVLSKEVNVKVEGSESWPDYVFKPSYKRMTLDEVEKFININGHLPNVASATEMVATGNNLNKTDIKLLEKVEELTLYLLEMKKANEVQNAEIQNLKKQVKSLRKK